MTARCFLRTVVVMLLVATGVSIRAEELGFPKGCVELEKVSFKWSFDTFSLRDSVLFRLVPGAADRTTEISQSFVAWDLDTGKWLARRPAPDSRAHRWMFSPDGKVLAVPVDDHARTVQLWEVGTKDIHGVPQLRLIAKLPQRKVLPNELQSGRPRGTTVCGVAWTPDSKTLLVNWPYPNFHTDHQILLWSFTDKPSVLSDSKQDEREPKAWKPWAKLEFDTAVDFAVSPDNQTLAVIQQRRKQQRLVDGHFFDPQTAQPREKFQFEPGSKSDAEILWEYRPVFSPDSKTLAIEGGEYFALWETSPPAPRVEMVRPDFLKISGPHHRFVFTPDGRWLLTRKIAQHKELNSFTGGMLQVRDAQTGKVHCEVSFPEKLGQFIEIDSLPDGRVRTRFLSRKSSQGTDPREFLWHADDLLRYAAEHGSPPL